MKLTETQKRTFAALDKIETYVFHVLDRARYEMAERKQPIYGNPAYDEAQRMMGYEWDINRPNCVALYEKNLKKCIAVMRKAGLQGTYTDLQEAYKALGKIQEA